MATAGNGVSLTTSPTLLFNAATGGDGGPCTTYMVKNRASSAGNVLVNVAGLHAPSDFVGLAPTPSSQEAREVQAQVRASPSTSGVAALQPSSRAARETSSTDRRTSPTLASPRSGSAELPATAAQAPKARAAGG